MIVFFCAALLRRDLVFRGRCAGVERDRCRDNSPPALTARAACPIWAATMPVHRASQQD